MIPPLTRVSLVLMVQPMIRNRDNANTIAMKANIMIGRVDIAGVFAQFLLFIIIRLA